MRDLLNNIDLKPVISPIATAIDNTAVVGLVIDRQGYQSLVYAIATGALPDVDATFTVLLEEGDVGTPGTTTLTAAAAVADADLLGTEALASFIFSDDNKVFKLGYKGNKRYTRLTITPGANTSASLLAAIAVLGNPDKAPTNNPPA